MSELIYLLITLTDKGVVFSLNNNFIVFFFNMYMAICLFDFLKLFFVFWFCQILNAYFNQNLTMSVQSMITHYC